MDNEQLTNEISELNDNQEDTNALLQYIEDLLLTEQETQQHKDEEEQRKEEQEEEQRNTDAQQQAETTETYTELLTTIHNDLVSITNLNIVTTVAIGLVIGILIVKMLIRKL